MPGTTSEAIATRLTDTNANTALAALVGTRIYPSKPTENAALPYVVYWDTGGDGMRTIAGRSRLQQYDVRIEVVAATEAETKAVMDEVRALLDLTRAQWRSLNLGVQGCFTAEDADQQTLEDGTEVAGQTFRLWFVPT